MDNTRDNIEKYLQKVRTENSVNIVKAIQVEYSDNEKAIKINKLGTTDEGFSSAVNIFENINSEIGRPSEEEAKKLEELFNDKVILTELINSRTKSIQGRCTCGRLLNVYDIISKSFNKDSHSVKFLSEAFSGKFGKVVVSGTDVTEQDKVVLPPETIWVENTSPVPCIQCGNLHDLSLVTEHVAHHWRLIAVE